MQRLSFSWLALFAFPFGEAFLGRKKKSGLMTNSMDESRGKFNLCCCATLTDPAHFTFTRGEGEMLFPEGGFHVAKLNFAHFKLNL